MTTKLKDESFTFIYFIIYFFCQKHHIHYKINLSLFFAVTIQVLKCYKYFYNVLSHSPEWLRA